MSLVPDAPDALPPDIPEEEMEKLAGRLADNYRKMGLYMTAMALNADNEAIEEGQEPHHILVAQFQIGDIAFSNRVMDPEAEKINDQFREIERGTVDDEIANIRARYEKLGNDPQEDH